LSGRGLCDELITRPEETYRLCCVVVCDLETSRIGAPYMYDISNLRVKNLLWCYACQLVNIAEKFIFCHTAERTSGLTSVFRDGQRLKKRIWGTRSLQEKTN